MKGKIVFWKDSFGFIRSEDDNKYFVHVTKIKDSDKLTPHQGDNVQFESIMSRKGAEAINVKRI